MKRLIGGELKLRYWLLRTSLARSILLLGLQRIPTTYFFPTLGAFLLTDMEAISAEIGKIVSEEIKRIIQNLRCEGVNNNQEYELAPLGAIAGGAILGYVSSFAFIEVNRKHLIFSWIAANSMSMFLVGTLFIPQFCSFSPYMC